MGYNAARWLGLDSRAMSVDIPSGQGKRTIVLPLEWTDVHYEDILAMFDAPARETVEEKDQGGNEDDHLQYLNINADDDFMPPPILDQEVAAGQQPQPRPVVVVQPEPDVVVVQPEPDVVVVQPEPNLELRGRHINRGESRLTKWIKMTIEACKNQISPKENEPGTGKRMKRKRYLIESVRLSFEVTDDIREFTVHLDDQIIGEFDHKRPRLMFEERIRGWEIRIKDRNDFSRYDWSFAHEKVVLPFRAATDVIRFILHNKYPIDPRCRAMRRS